MRNQAGVQFLDFGRHGRGQVLLFAEIILQVIELHRTFVEMNQFPRTFTYDAVGTRVVAIMRKMPVDRLCGPEALLAGGKQMIHQRGAVNFDSLPGKSRRAASAMVGR